MSETLKIDVVVYGAGPAGIIAATNLLRKGKSVIVIEKQTFPRFVIGESLLPKCMEYLEELEFLECVEKDNHQLKRGAIFNKGKKEIKFNFSEQYTQGANATWEVKRSKFDYSLAKEAERKGVRILYNTTVTDTKFHDTYQETTATATDKTITIKSKFVIDASGYGRVLPKMLQLEEKAKSVNRGAIFGHLTDRCNDASLREYIRVSSFNNNESWIWAIPFSDGSCSVGIVGEKSYLETLIENNYKEYNNTVANLEELEGRFGELEWKIAPKHLFGYSIGIKKLYGKGFVLCGNATEFLDPIFSSGVTLAMASGYDASELVNSQLDGETVNWENAYEKPMRAGIEVFRSYIDAWYTGELQTIFFSDNIDKLMKEQICSVLAGHVWDKTNPFVTKHKTIIKTLSEVVQIEGKMRTRK